MVCIYQIKILFFCDTMVYGIDYTLIVFGEW